MAVAYTGRYNFNKPFGTDCFVIPAGKGSALAGYVLVHVA